VVFRLRLCVIIILLWGFLTRRADVCSQDGGVSGAEEYVRTAHILIYCNRRCWPAALMSLVPNKEQIRTALVNFKDLHADGMSNLLVEMMDPLCDVTLNHSLPPILPLNWVWPRLRLLQ
jgi:hypothetical protein